MILLSVLKNLKFKLIVSEGKIYRNQIDIRWQSDQNYMQNPLKWLKVINLDMQKVRNSII